MAICGHYCPPMSHSQAPLLLRVFSTTLALTPWWLLLLMFMLSFSPLRHNTLTHQYACSHARRCLSVSKMGEIHRQAPNMECLMEDRSPHAASPHRVYPSFNLFLLLRLVCSFFNLSMSACPVLSISADVWPQLWIRSLWVKP